MAEEDEVEAYIQSGYSNLPLGQLVNEKDDREGRNRRMTLLTLQEKEALRLWKGLKDDTRLLARPFVTSTYCLITEEGEKEKEKKEKKENEKEEEGERGQEERKREGYALNENESSGSGSNSNNFASFSSLARGGKKADAHFWLKAFCSRLMSRIETEEKVLFLACQSVMSVPLAAHVALYLVPYLVKNVVQFGKKEDREYVKAEIVAVLRCVSLFFLFFFCRFVFFLVSFLFVVVLFLFLFSFTGLFFTAFLPSLLVFSMFFLSFVGVSFSIISLFFVFFFVFFFFVFFCRRMAKTAKREHDEKNTSQLEFNGLLASPLLRTLCYTYLPLFLLFSFFSFSPSTFRRPFHYYILKRICSQIFRLIHKRGPVFYIFAVD